MTEFLSIDTTMNHRVSAIGIRLRIRIQTTKDSYYREYLIDDYVLRISKDIDVVSTITAQHIDNFKREIESMESLPESSTPEQDKLIQDLIPSYIKSLKDSAFEQQD